MLQSFDLGKKYQIDCPKDIDPKIPVLIAEDQSDLRLIVVHQLSKLNFRDVHQAANGVEAVELARRITFGIIICDFEMPHMSGIEFLQELREDPKMARVPLVMTLADVNREKLMLAVEHGADEILAKPYALSDIGPKIQSAFRLFHRPSNPEKVYEFAKWLVRKNQFDEAEKVYHELASASPQSARPHVGLARIRLAQGKLDDALTLLEAAEACNEHYVHTFTERANVFMKLGKEMDALAAFRQAIYISPRNAYRYKHAIDILFTHQKYGEAIELLGIATQNEIRFAELYHYLSQANFRLGQFENAARAIRHALRQEKDNLIYMNQLGICLKELNRFSEAQDVYNRVIKLNPEDKAGLYNKAVLMAAKGDFAEAIRLLKKVLEKHPEFNQAKSKLVEFEAQSKFKAS